MTPFQYGKTTPNNIGAPTALAPPPPADPWASLYNPAPTWADFGMLIGAPGATLGGGGTTSPNLAADDPKNPFFGTSAVGLNANQAPSYPRYRSAVDPTTGKPADPYSYQSQWLPMAQMQLNSNLSQASNQANNLGARNASAAASNLAMKGGLTSGANERLQYQGQKDTSSSLQNILANANTQRLGLATSAADKDLQTAIGDLDNSNQYNAGLFSTMAQIYGANQTANAQANAAKKQKNIFGGDSILIPGFI